ncbi:MAG: hypothetical protein HFG41_01855 [Coprococcus sp.]|nr:hypothetical protein [Coprococcus sp.]
MWKYILKRIVMIIPVLIGVTFFVYMVLSLAPGDPVQTILGDKATEEAQEQLREELGLDKPILVQYANYMVIVPKAVVEADPDGFLEHPIGCGPYEFEEWNHGNYCKIKAYDDYFLGKAKTENITFRIIPEASQRTIAL